MSRLLVLWEPLRRLACNKSDILYGSSCSSFLIIPLPLQEFQAQAASYCHSSLRDLLVSSSNIVRSELPGHGAFNGFWAAFTAMPFLLAWQWMSYLQPSSLVDYH